VASEFFDEVILCDRDDIPQSPHTRQGVPQGHHFHAILPGGLGIMEKFLPDLTTQLRAAGAVRSTMGREFYSYWPQGVSYSLNRFAPNPFDGPDTYFQSRALLEHVIRRNVEALANVEARYRTQVREPIAEELHVRGVQVTTDDGGENLACDLYIDATGKAPRTLPWLEKLGYQRPPEDVIGTDFAYTSVFLKPRDWDAFEGFGFFVVPDPNGPFPTRIGGLIKLEDGHWIAFLGGRFGDYPPREIASFAPWARTLHTPVIADLIEGAEPLSEPVAFRFPRSIRRRFAEMETFPEGLLPFGDAVLHFNPIYGQGMSSSCRQALALHALLTARREDGRGLAGLAQEFLPAANEETRGAWLYAALSDFAAPETTGDFPEDEAESIAMMKFLESIAGEEPDALRTLIGVSTLMAPLSIFTSERWREAQAAAGSSV
jgi:2-polyprenyl-6-methoxyphenol hydroxylase-like FAD-dependent oxidoreductase